MVSWHNECYYVSRFFKLEALAFKEARTDRELKSAEAGCCGRNRAPIWIGETDRKREMEQEKGAREQLHVHLRLLVLLV